VWSWRLAHSCRCISWTTCSSASGGSGPSEALLLLVQIPGPAPKPQFVRRPDGTGELQHSHSIKAGKLHQGECRMRQFLTRDAFVIRPDVTLHGSSLLQL